MTTNLDPNGQPITDVAELNAAIEAADGEAASSGAYEIDLAANTPIDLTQALEAINLKSGVTLDIVGNGATLNGQGDQRGLFVYAGVVTIENLTIEDAKAVGGDGGDGAGGGAGLGGGVFVGSNVAGDAGDVTLTKVNFSTDGATAGRAAFSAPLGTAAAAAAVSAARAGRRRGPAAAASAAGRAAARSGKRTARGASSPGP